MAITKPTVGGNDGTWGPILNTALDALDTAATAAQSTASAAQSAASANSAMLRRPFNKSGYWYQCHPSTSAQPLVAANGFYVPIFFDRIVTIDQIALKVTTAGDGAAVLRLGIYADDGAGKPTGSSLGTVGTLDVSTTGVKVATPGTAIALSAAGLYWLYVQVEATTAPSMTAVATNLAPVPNSSSNNDPSVISNCWTVGTISSGSLPTAVPASITAVSYRAPASSIHLSAVS